jgi:hypothetical protein
MSFYDYKRALQAAKDYPLRSLLMALIMSTKKNGSLIDYTALEDLWPDVAKEIDARVRSGGVLEEDGFKEQG